MPLEKTTAILCTPFVSTSDPDNTPALAAQGGVATVTRVWMSTSVLATLVRTVQRAQSLIVRQAPIQWALPAIHLQGDYPVLIATHALVQQASPTVIATTLSYRHTQLHAPSQRAVTATWMCTSV